MSAQLRIWSTRAPFRRAKFAWGDVNEPRIVDVVDLDGARLHALIHEPVLRIEVLADGNFAALPLAFADLTAEDLDKLIDTARAAAPAAPISPEQSEIERLEAGWDDARKSVAAVTEERDAARQEADALRAELAELREKHDALEKAAAAPPAVEHPAVDQTNSSTAPPASNEPAKRKTPKAG